MRHERMRDNDIPSGFESEFGMGNKQRKFIEVGIDDVAFVVYAGVLIGGSSILMASWSQKRPIKLVIGDLIGKDWENNEENPGENLYENEKVKIQEDKMLTLKKKRAKEVVLMKNKQRTLRIKRSNIYKISRVRE